MDLNNFIRRLNIAKYSLAAIRSRHTPQYIKEKLHKAGAPLKHRLQSRLKSTVLNNTVIINIIFFITITSCTVVVIGYI